VVRERRPTHFVGLTNGQPCRDSDGTPDIPGDRSIKLATHVEGRERVAADGSSTLPASIYRDRVNAPAPPEGALTCQEEAPAPRRAVRPPGHRWGSANIHGEPGVRATASLPGGPLGSSTVRSPFGVRLGQ